MREFAPWLTSQPKGMVLTTGAASLRSKLTSQEGGKTCEPSDLHYVTLIQKQTIGRHEKGGIVALFLVPSTGSVLP